MATKTTKTETAVKTYVKYDREGKKVLDTEKTSNPVLRNELLTSGYREEKTKATASDSSGSGGGSNASSGSGK